MIGSSGWIGRSIEILIAGAMLSLALVTSGYCQSEPNSEAATEAEDEIEEIRVYGHKSLPRLQLEVYAAESAYFDYFNSMSSDDDYDIHCFREAQTGSRLKRRVCKTNYLIRLEAEASEEWVRSLQAGRSGSYRDPRARVRRLDAIVQEEMDTLAAEKPEFLELLNEYSNKKQIYDSERRRRCEGRIILCR